MKPSPDKLQSEFSKILTAACVRRGYLEKLHAGITPVTLTGDYSDVKVIDADGREIPWNQVSRIDQNEMKTLITGVVNRIHTFLTRTIYAPTRDLAFEQALERTATPWTKAWDEPKYLPDFLMSSTQLALAFSWPFIVISGQIDPRNEEAIRPFFSRQLSVNRQFCQSWGHIGGLRQGHQAQTS